MTTTFDGRRYAKAKHSIIEAKISKLKKRGACPKLVSIIVGDDKASKLYLSIKQKLANKLGAKLEIERFDENCAKEKIISFINHNNVNNKVHGIMVQLPLPSKFNSKDREQIIKSITRDKDVDGLREDSIFITPVVKAIIEVVKEASNIVRLPTHNNQIKVVVIGAKGFEGKKITKMLKKMGYLVKGVDKKTDNLKKYTITADILVSATGSPSLIKKDMIKEGVVIVDVGSPVGDVDVKAYERAAFVSPVPGGIGPVTVVNLLENLVDSV